MNWLFTRLWARGFVSGLFVFDLITNLVSTGVFTNLFRSRFSVLTSSLFGLFPIIERCLKSAIFGERVRCKKYFYKAKVISLVWGVRLYLFRFWFELKDSSSVWFVFIAPCVPFLSLWVIFLCVSFFSGLRELSLLYG